MSAGFVVCAVGGGPVAPVGGGHRSATLPGIRVPHLRDEIVPRPALISDDLRRPRPIQLGAELCPRSRLHLSGCGLTLKSLNAFPS